MKLEKLNVAGFRGFNEARELSFADTLTVISARNSHGKTSISEALEFLLEGETSKVSGAAFSKEEYKDSYRNKHYPSDASAFVEAVFVQSDGRKVTWRVELSPSGEQRRLVDGQPTDRWPISWTARPFVLQHALKHLLLVEPADRFAGFASLLGLQETEAAYQGILDLCTKPTTLLPKAAAELLEQLEKMMARLAAEAPVKKAASYLKKGVEGLDGATSVIEARGRELARPKDSLIDDLKALREGITKRFYSGDVRILPAGPRDGELSAQEYKQLDSLASTRIVEDFGRVCVASVTERMRTELALREAGAALLVEDGSKCPLCDRPVDSELLQHIVTAHRAIQLKVNGENELEAIRRQLEHAIDSIRNALLNLSSRLDKRLAGLFAGTTEENLTKLRNLLGAEGVSVVDAILSVATESKQSQASMQNAVTASTEALNRCQLLIRGQGSNLDDVATAAKRLKELIDLAQTREREIEGISLRLEAPSASVRAAVDKLAGTGELSVLIDYLDQLPRLRKALRIRDAVEGLKELRKHSEQALGELMDSAMTGELTGLVMSWYDKIRTTTDPDVHFAGFSMEKTKAGDYKSRRVGIKAKSYGVHLASAVSSLSESKLNALGLCVSIASALRKGSPWQFLIVDDPIQSWDDEHEQQFARVVRELIENEKRQLIVLTHKSNWADQLCDSCRSLNGERYEITGYGKTGPVIGDRDWAKLDNRLREASAIVDDLTASTIRLQQGQEEIRLAATLLAAEVSTKVLHNKVSAKNMGGSDVRQILVRAGVEKVTVDAVYGLFPDANAAHHESSTHEPSREKLKQAIMVLRQVEKNVLKNGSA